MKLGDIACHMAGKAVCHEPVMGVMVGAQMDVSQEFATSFEQDVSYEQDTITM